LVVSDVLHSYALVLRRNGLYGPAEEHLRRALRIQEEALGPDSPHLAPVLHALAHTYILCDRPSDAQPLISRALALNRAAWGPSHSQYATSLNLFALFLQHVDHRQEAETVMRRVLSIRERTLGTTHVEVASAMNVLANLLSSQVFEWCFSVCLCADGCLQARGLPESLDLLNRAIRIRRQRLHAEHPELARSYATAIHLSLGRCLSLCGRYNNKALLHQHGVVSAPEAETLFREAITIREKHLPTNHMETAASLHNLGVLLLQMDRYDEAETFLRRAIAMREILYVRGPCTN
jgi:tetratricopeptide (TPR) repeat protein